MKIYKQKIFIETKTQIEFIDITDRVQEIVDHSGVREGQVLVFAPHTTMSVGINHHEAMLIQDFTRIMYKLVPVDDRYSHDLFELRKETMSDGRSNGHSHCKSLLMGSSETIPVERGTLFLGDRQQIFAIEFDGARKRDILVQVMGL
jgi:secondary thiamine-phosphate synthase enzyme